MFQIADNYRISRKIAAQGMVLLKNEGEILPFQPTDRVGVIGKECLNLIKGGGGSAAVKCEYIRSLLDGLSEKESEGKIKLNRDSFAFAENSDYADYTVEKLNDLAKTCDKVIFTFQRYGTEGDDRRLGDKITRENCHEGEDDDKQTLRFYPSRNELRLLERIEQSDIHNVVLLLNVAATVDFSFFASFPKLKAILLTYLPGMECGTAIADVLTGDVNPSGRLVDTVAWDYPDYPSAPYYDKDKETSVYGEGIFVGYRYFETYAKEKVQYPFGHGLSYTDFAFSDSRLTAGKDALTVSVTVKNTGKRAGREVVQIYVSAPDGKLVKPAVELKGFAKTKDLAPNETQTVTVTIPFRTIASFDDTGATGFVGAWVLEKGTYRIYAGKSSRDLTLAGTWDLPETKVMEQATLRFDGSEYQYIAKWSDTEGKGVAEYSLYDVADGKATMETFVNQMTPEELTSLALGQPLAFPAGTSGLGNLKKYGVPNPQTADGPAGIRRSVNTTCFPCATLVACSWDEDLLFAMGSAMGIEGYSTGLDVILGPAMNLHRNPLGGRCFEYFSEDPLITGKTASALVRGLQSQGLCATLKHFAANSCEYFRCVNNSSVPERTLRELYLRGFEIAVKEGNPAFIMTSYNIVNGKHSSANAQLLRGILRDEWKYEGAVMTDWRNGVPLKDEIAAGNNIKMPFGYPDEGMKALKAYREGKLPLSMFKENAAYVLTAVMKTRSFAQHDFGVIHTLDGDVLDIPPMEVNGLASSRICHAKKPDGTDYLYQLNREQRNQRSFVYYVLNVKKGGKFRVTAEISTNCPETEIWFTDEKGTRLGTAYCKDAVDAEKWYPVEAEIELQTGENFLKLIFANEPNHDYEFFCPTAEIPNAWPVLAKEDISFSKFRLTRIQ